MIYPSEGFGKRPCSHSLQKKKELLGFGAQSFEVSGVLLPRVSDSRDAGATTHYCRQWMSPICCCCSWSSFVGFGCHQIIDTWEWQIDDCFELPAVKLSCEVNPEVEIKDMMASKRPGEEENDFAMVVKRQRTEQSNNQLGVTSEVRSSLFYWGSFV